MSVVLGRPGDVRGFIHRKIFGGIKGAIGGLASGGPLGIIGGAARGFVTGGQKRRQFPGFQLPSERAVAPPPTAGFTPRFPILVSRPMAPRPPPSRADAACPPGFTMSGGQCVETFGGQVKKPGFRGGLERFLPGGETGFEEFGEAVMGQYGAALQPAVRSIESRLCPRGSVLGTDGLCYNRRDISNKERFWPRGRRPLLTGGEMRAISTASAAAKKLQKKQKQLQQLGLLKAPSARRAPKMLPSGHHAHVHHDGG